MKKNKTNVLAEERELLRKQLELLAEQSDVCASARCKEELSMLSAQMVAIYSVLRA